jgi:hypothetical protein
METVLHLKVPALRGFNDDVGFSEPTSARGCGSSSWYLSWDRRITGRIDDED